MATATYRTECPPGKFAPKNMSNTDLVIDGACGGCKQSIRLRVPNPVAGQQVAVKCPECAQTVQHTISQKDLLIHYVKLDARAEVRREYARNHDI